MNLWLICGLAFVCVALLVGVVLYAFAGPEGAIRRRLDRIKRGGGPEGPETPRGGGGDRLPVLSSLLERSGRQSALERQLQRAGFNWRPSEFAAAVLLLLVALGVAGWMLYGALGAAAGAVISVALPVFGLKALEAWRLRKFERQLPDALMLIASSLRSGFGILRALQAVSDEMEPPVSVELRRALEEANVGVPVGEALTHLVQRVPLPDLNIAVTAILIQLEAGGNLAEVMETVAGTVRERGRLRAEMQTLTAEARLSGIVLFLLPLGMAVILAALNRGYMSILLRTSLGHLLIICALSLQLLGGVVMKRMLRFDF
jgi:tight adherence protein B